MEVLFKNTLFINLSNRTDRLDHINAELLKLNIKGERVNAIKHTHGAIGCSSSHIKCLELAIERDYEHVFICEDDITFLDIKLFEANIKKFVENDKITWDVLIISGNNQPPFQQREEYCARIFNCQCTTGYVVKKSYYINLLNNFKDGLSLLMKSPTNKPNFAIDMYWKQLQPRDFWYMITPLTVTQYANYSDVEENNTDYARVMLDMEKKWLNIGKNIF